VRIFGEAARIHREVQLETPRCGRCAHVLPDETLSFCPYCGVPFSKVPPTSSFELLASRREKKRVQVFRRKLYSVTAVVFFGFWLMLFSSTELYNFGRIEKLAETRKIRIYFYDDPRYPALTLYQKHNAIAIATESFQEHFGIQLSDIEISHGVLPAELEEHWSWKEERHTSLSFWEKTFFPQQQKIWARDPMAPLPLFITNFPIRNDHPTETNIQTEHLSKNQLVSGLGHPTFSVITAYRIFQEEEILFPKVQKKNLSTLQSRYLGEYVIAHELGHALLGLPDYTVIEQESEQEIRSPASIGAAKGQSRINYRECLMHSDFGGGFKAWEELAGRKMDEKLTTYCPEYVPTIEAFLIRSRAVSRLKAGYRSEAEALHSEALEKISVTPELWTAALWQREHQLFLSPWDRWWSGLKNLVKK
jgi:hypothetical protein